MFQVTTNGLLTTLVPFTWPNGTGLTALTPGPDDALYGVTLGGGTNGTGTLFKLTGIPQCGQNLPEPAIFRRKSGLS